MRNSDLIRKHAHKIMNQIMMFADGIVPINHSHHLSKRANIGETINDLNNQACSPIASAVILWQTKLTCKAFQQHKSSRDSSHTHGKMFLRTTLPSKRWMQLVILWIVQWWCWRLALWGQYSTGGRWCHTWKLSFVPLMYLSDYRKNLINN